MIITTRETLKMQDWGRIGPTGSNSHYCTVILAGKSNIVTPYSV